MPKLTKRFVDSVKPPETGEATYWDDSLPAFGLRVRPSGRKTYVLMYRVNGRLRKATLGQHGTLTPDEARTEAHEQLGAVRKGHDPAAERADRRRAPTMADLAERYLAEHADVHKKATSAARDREILRTRIFPALGSRKVAEVTRADVGKLHHSMRDIPYRANRTLALLSKMFNLAEAWGLRPDGSNPCRHVRRYREKRRERFLSREELARLGDALQQADQEGSEAPDAIAAIRLLIFTGCRKSEVLQAQWEMVDWERACLRLPESKTGAKVIALNTPALQVLTGLQARTDGSPWIVGGQEKGTPLGSLDGAWQRIRKSVGLENVRLHDLRHSFASVAAGAGQSLPMIGKLLGHTQAATTQRYAHLADDPVRAASETVGARLAATMKGRLGEVVSMPTGKRHRNRRKEH